MGSHVDDHRYNDALDRTCVNPNTHLSFTATAILFHDLWGNVGLGEG